MSTLKEQAQIIRDETLPGANTAQRIGDMFVDLVNEVEKKLSTGSLAQGTGSSTTNAMSQDAVTKELAKRVSKDSLAQGTGSSTTTPMSQKAVTTAIDAVDKVYITSLDITTKTTGYTISAEDKKELENIRSKSADMAIYCKFNSSWYTIIYPDGDIWNPILKALIGTRIYTVTNIISPTTWKITFVDLASGGTETGNGTYVTNLNIKSLSGQSNSSQITEIQNMIDAIAKGQVVVFYLDPGTVNYNETLILSARKTGGTDNRSYYLSAISTEGVIYKATANVTSDIWGEGGDTYGTWTTSKIDMTVSGSGGIEDVEQQSTTGFSFERVNKAWVARSYYTDGNIGKIQNANSSEYLAEALGDFSDFMKAVAQGLNIYSVEYYSTLDVENYQTHIPIYYKKRSDLGNLELWWTVGTVTTNIVVDVSDGWGDILAFKQVDTANVDRPYCVHILSALSMEDEITETPNGLQVRLDRELQDGYALVLLRRKKVRYSHANGRFRNKGISYRLVTEEQGACGSGYRNRTGFIANLNFGYDKTDKRYRLMNSSGLVDPFDFAIRYTEDRDGVLRISGAGRSSKKLFNYHDPDNLNTNKHIRIKIQFGIAVIKYENSKDVNGGYKICSNIAKLEFIFSNVGKDGLAIGEVCDDGELRKGFEMRVID